MIRYNVSQQIYFNKQLRGGKKYEKRAANKICQKNNVTVVLECNNYKYDFMTSDSVTYEVKHDMASVITNNFFIECASDGKPSGILTTEAQYHILISDNIYYLILTETLKRLIHDKKYIRPASTNITNRTDGFLFSKEVITQNSVSL